MHLQPAWQRLESGSLRAIKPLNRCGRVRAARNSPSGVIVWQYVVRRHTYTPVPQSPGDRRERRKHEAHLGSTSASQPAPKIALKANHKVRLRSEECLGGRALDLAQSRLNTKVRRLRHKSSWSWLESSGIKRKVLVLIPPHFCTFGEAFPAHRARRLGPCGAERHLTSGRAARVALVSLRRCIGRTPERPRRSEEVVLGDGAAAFPLVCLTNAPT